MAAGGYLLMKFLFTLYDRFDSSNEEKQPALAKLLSMCFCKFVSKLTITAGKKSNFCLFIDYSASVSLAS